MNEHPDGHLKTTRYSSHLEKDSMIIILSINLGILKYFQILDVSYTFPKIQVSDLSKVFEADDIFTF